MVLAGFLMFFYRNPQADYEIYKKRTKRTHTCNFRERTKLVGCQWLMPVILTAWEAEITRIAV
jgi:hypothetical protein